MKSVYLAIESSCDETAVALVASNGEILGERIASQIESHRRYGGVVPEVASRAHFEALQNLVEELMKESSRTQSFRVTGVAATCGPGLIGPLLVGACYGQGWAAGAGCPFVGVHHLRGHVASALIPTSGEVGGETLRERAQRIFPALVLLVSGGHTQILEVDADLRVRPLADTADDAAGECFDKAAKLMGLPYPGGPEIERLAAQLKPEDQGRARELQRALPKPRSAEGFSFSGLKTAVRLRLEKEPELAASPAFCWALQETIAEVLVRGLETAWTHIESSLTSFVLCGGVASNRRIRQCLEEWARSRGLEARFPPLRYATDNAVMIGAAAWVQETSLALQGISARVAL